jgi:hypothetical protein
MKCEGIICGHLRYDQVSPWSGGNSCRRGYFATPSWQMHELLILTSALAQACSNFAW